MKFYISLFILVLVFSVSGLIAKDKEMKVKEVPVGELLKVEIIANYEVSNIQWFKDGVPIKGANKREYTVRNARLSDQGIYYATMQGPCREMESTPLLVKVNFDSQKGIETVTAGGNYLFQNEPNPASDNAKIKFNLAENSLVKIILTDMFGKEIATVFNGQASAGINVVDLNINSFNLTNGTYFYSLIGDNFTETKSLIILK